MLQLLARLKKQWQVERNRCQSCGMPLCYDKNPLPQGTIYCSYCHDGRAFRQTLDLAAMRRKINALLTQRKTPALVRFYMRWRLATLRRWRERDLDA